MVTTVPQQTDIDSSTVTATPQRGQTGQWQRATQDVMARATTLGVESKVSKELLGNTKAA